MKVERKVEYRVREVTRYVVTRYYESGKIKSSATRGEFENLHTAQQVAFALCRVEDIDSKDDPSRPKFKYPNVYPVEAEVEKE